MSRCPAALQSFSQACVNRPGDHERSRQSAGSKSRQAWCLSLRFGNQDHRVAGAAQRCGQALVAGSPRAFARPAPRRNRGRSAPIRSGFEIRAPDRISRSSGSSEWKVSQLLLQETPAARATAADRAETARPEPSTAGWLRASPSAEPLGRVQRRPRQFRRGERNHQIERRCPLEPVESLPARFACFMGLPAS